MDWATTSTILCQLQDFNHRPAWAFFHAHMRRPIVSFACRMGLGRADADDVAQETMLAFATRYRGGAYDRSKGRLRKWLYGIALRQIRNAHRRLSRREEQFSEQIRAELELTDDRSLSAWEQEWERALLHACLERVRHEVEPLTFQAFARVVRDERPPMEVAGELGVPVKTIYNAKHRVLKRVRELRDLEP
ncbi:MAG: sigma-70 family RNA polymerase sigma factor [Planctomycetes bacterium]|nr:sigma-70 family RNA polymerase sigma factor [Planctomycetota bacterium]